MYSPDELGRDERRLASLQPLTVHERRWLELQRSNAELMAADNDRRRMVGPGKKLNTAMDRWKQASDNVAQALASASVVEPPQPPPSSLRRGSDVSDPTLSQIEATWNAVDRACVAYAHLMGRCPAEGCVVCDRDNDTLTALAETLDLTVDLSEAIDGVLGTPSSSETAFHNALKAAAHANWNAADAIRDGWHDLRRAGADDDVLTSVADRSGWVAGRMQGLVGAVTQWLPPLERRCAAGCGGAAPSLGQGATCERCRQANSRKEAS